MPMSDIAFEDRMRARIVEAISNGEHLNQAAKDLEVKA